MASYMPRQAAYDLNKLRGKSLVERIDKTRRYRVRRPGIRTLAALLILREQVIKPVLAGVYRRKRGRPPKTLHPLDVHYQKLQCEMMEKEEIRIGRIGRTLRQSSERSGHVRRKK